MSEIIEYLRSWLSIFPRMTIGNVLEIIIIAFFVYCVLLWVKNTRSWALLRGILVIAVFILICQILRLDTILWIAGKVATVAAIALIVIFQPELRKALERLGNRSFFPVIFREEMTNGFNGKIISEIVRAAFELSKTKTGALIIIEGKESLAETERTGIPIDGVVSNQLLINIFEHNTPLHDGAVVVRGDRIVAATCYLPLSDSRQISKMYGTRHRAALGISEITDSLTVVVSEETGRVSVAENGLLTTMQNEEELTKTLRKLEEQEENVRKFILKRKNN